MNYRTIDIPDDNGQTRVNKALIMVSVKDWDICNYGNCQMLIDPDATYCIFHEQVVEKRRKK
ncbi:MAG TPA: hypothetical protein VFK94_06540 [Patescibacteria group bacterium]|nr:hypothetical protein [Patescibacteria group bacterium]